MTKLQNILVAMYKLEIVNIIIILTIYWKFKNSLVKHNPPNDSFRTGVILFTLNILYFLWKYVLSFSSL